MNRLKPNTLKGRQQRLAALLLIFIALTVIDPRSLLVQLLAFFFLVAIIFSAVNVIRERSAMKSK
ncbi:hypothetical protein [Lacticaseibacillus saniviri]